MKTKAISYAYPTSPDAVKFGFSKTGCYVVDIFQKAQPPQSFKRFATKAEAIAFANTMPEPWHPRREPAMDAKSLPVMKTETQSIAKEPRALIVFPSICNSLGGASTVSHNNTFAWVTLPGHEKPIRVPMSKLPAIDKWTSFNLADATALFLASKK